MNTHNNFDERFEFDMQRSFVKKVDYLEDGCSLGTIDARFSNAIEAGKNGYAYVFFTNESNSSVFIDNFYLEYFSKLKSIDDINYYLRDFLFYEIKTDRDFFIRKNLKNENLIEKIVDTETLYTVFERC